MTAAVELLTRAAELVERVGLHKGDYWPGQWSGRPYVEGDPCCLFGALVIRAGERNEPEQALVLAVVGAAKTALEAATGYRDALSEWNDHPDTTAAQVAAALREATSHVPGVES